MKPITLETFLYVALMAAISTIGCLDEGAYQCGTSAECTNGGLQGTCEANGFCSFPDEECESGRRFGGSADDGVAGECVGATTAIACGPDSQIEAGDRHTCSLVNGVVRCWGSNESGQLGNGTELATSSPLEVLGLGVVTKITAGLAHTCALTQAGTVHCWGSNDSGQLGLPASNEPVTLPALAMIDAVDVSAGENHTCAIKSDGTAWCWGLNDQGQLGDDTGQSSYRPVMAEGLSAVTAITAGYDHTCALQDGSVYCWGADNQAQLGDVEEGNQLAPIDIALAGIETLEAGGDHTCAVSAENEVYCWGANGAGQIGNGNNEPQPQPQLLYALRATQISARGDHTCAFTAEGELRCWGRNDYGQLGNGELENATVGVTVPGVAGVTDIATGELHTCVFVDGAGVSCWGRNDFGQLGIGDTLRSATAVDVPGLTAGQQSVAVGSNHSCALDAGGLVQCWGRVQSGELGISLEGEERIPEMLGPTAVSALTGVTSIYSGANRGCARAGTSILCWGSDDDGLLGDGNNGTQQVPTALTEAIVEPASISLGDNHTCAIDGVGAVYCWGDNGSGQLGSAIGSTTTAQVAAAAPVAADQVVVGNNHSCALEAGAVSCWGGNGAGQLGDTTTDTPAAGTAVTVTLPATALSLTAGSAHTCALLDGGGVFCWGANGSGQLGLPDEGNVVPSPTQVGLPAGATAVVAEDNNTCALLDDSRVFCWGSNANQKLGLDLTIADSAAPTEIPDLLATQVSVSGSHVCAITTDGAARCWGDNEFTELGSDRVAMATAVTQTELLCASAPADE